MKSLSKLFLLLALLTTQQNILSAQKNTQSNDFVIGWIKKGPFAHMAYETTERAEKELHLPKTLREELFKTYGKYIEITKRSETRIEVNEKSFLMVQAIWTRFNYTNCDAMNPYNKFLGFVVNLATRALEKC